MKYDEYELIEFFGVLPSEQEAEEKEFFGTTIFDYYQSKYRLSVSYSTYHDDLYLYLKDTSVELNLLELQLEGVEEITVRRDKPNSAPTLIIKARGNVECNREIIIQTVHIALQPNIYIKIVNH